MRGWTAGAVDCWPHRALLGLGAGEGGGRNLLCSKAKTERGLTA